MSRPDQLPNTPRTAAGQEFDHAWPGTTYDRLQWREAILAIEAEAAAGLDVERLALAIANVSGDGRVLDVDREETRKVAAEYNRFADVQSMAEAAAGLDVERLAAALWHATKNMTQLAPLKIEVRDLAERIAAEYNPRPRMAGELPGE